MNRNLLIVSAAAIAVAAAGGASAATHKHHHGMSGRGRYAAPSQPIPYDQVDAYVGGSHVKNSQMAAPTTGSYTTAAACGAKACAANGRPYRQYCRAT